MYNIETLAKLAGISRRAVRFYIQRGLLSPPEGQARGAYYTEKHLERLKEILKLSGQGVPLQKMNSVLDGGLKIKEEGAVYRVDGGVRKSRWERVEILKGVELHFYPNLLDEDDLSKIKNFISKIAGEKD
ncbi:MAG: hypothetical protein A2017_17430 [Lentisphaerae bacterium GWF2_44_16]|nr:MAG: hypothetical protein A2017_17430 [Lentisphaerae bacterium GWF2_44_16]